jgi:uncharacterized lipoprotein YmbA
MHKLALIIVTLMLAACASKPLQLDDDLEHEIAESKASGAALGTMAVPVSKWLEFVILQMFQNVKLNVDVKLDNPQKAK